MNRMTIILILIAVLTGCTKEELSPRAYPRIDTEQITAITANSVTLHGNIFYASVEILDHGFIWTDAGYPSLTSGTKISLGPKTTPGLFEATVTEGLQSGKVYSVCAYARSEDHVVYGKIIEFEQP